MFLGSWHWRERSATLSYAITFHYLAIRQSASVSLNGIGMVEIVVRALRQFLSCACDQSLLQQDYTTKVGRSFLFGKTTASKWLQLN